MKVNRYIMFSLVFANIKPDFVKFGLRTEMVSPFMLAHQHFMCFFVAPLTTKVWIAVTVLVGEGSGLAD